MYREMEKEGQRAMGATWKKLKKLLKV